MERVEAKLDRVLGLRELGERARADWGEAEAEEEEPESAWAVAEGAAYPGQVASEVARSEVRVRPTRFNSRS